MDKSTKWWAILSMSLLAGCSGDADQGPKTYDYTRSADCKTSAAGTDCKALIYNLIGRWFPKDEIRRLDDDSMTPEAWCARDPSHIFVHLDEVEVQCDQGPSHSAAIARVSQAEQGGIQLILRATEDAPLRTLIFERVQGTSGMLEGDQSTALVAGSPCFNGQQAEHARFPKVEVLRRQIMGGRRCTQIQDDDRGVDL